MSEIKQKRLQILLKLFGEQIKQKIETENLNISVKELLNKFADYEITESGKYLEWMTKAYIGNGFLYEDLYKVKETLEIFHENKMKLSKDKRDIQQYKILADLWIEVKKFVEQEDYFLSTNEQKRKGKELAYSETEFLYEDDNVRLVAPLTKKSSQWWGKGTRWCTAADKNNMFMEYFEDAPLLIFDFKNGEKWQLWMFDKIIQFMDEDDNKLSEKKIRNKWDIIEEVFSVLLKLNTVIIKFIPKEFTKQFYELAVQKNCQSLYYIPKKMKTTELCEIAIKQNGMLLLNVPEKFKTEELCEMAVKQNGLALQYIPKELKTQELCEIAVQSNGVALRFMPENFKTKELCEIAVQNNAVALDAVPEEFITKELSEFSVRQNGMFLSVVPLKLRTEELCKIAVEQNGWALYEVPDELRTKELCELSIQQINKNANHKKDNIVRSNNLDKYKEIFLKSNKNNYVFVK